MALGSRALRPVTRVEESSHDSFTRGAAGFEFGGVRADEGRATAKLGRTTERLGFAGELEARVAEPVPRVRHGAGRPSQLIGAGVAEAIEVALVDRSPELRSASAVGGRLDRRVRAARQQGKRDGNSCGDRAQGT